MDEKKMMEVLRTAQGNILSFASSAQKSTDVKFKRLAVKEIVTAMQDAIDKLNSLNVQPASDTVAGKASTSKANQTL